jgi:hypothetical protein
MLVVEGYHVTSRETWDYNCIAFAASDEEKWWWPDAHGKGYWPPGIAREETVPAFIAAYGTLGYEECDNGDIEQECEKVAISGGIASLNPRLPIFEPSGFIL